MLKLYTKPDCSACTQTKKWLEREKLDFEILQIEDHLDVLEEAKASGAMGAPICVTDQGIWWAGLNLGQLKAYRLVEEYKKSSAGGVDKVPSVS